jgi:hypothetical protein
MQTRFSPFVLAIIISLLVVVAGLLHALKQHPPYAPNVHAEQEADGTLKGEENAKPGAVEAAKLDKKHGGKHAEQRDEEGTEFWPTVLGLRLKITDSLLAIFTGGLLIFTGLLWRSTEKLWTASENQSAITRDALIGDQRAWIVTSIEIDTVWFSQNHVDVSARLKVTNVGKTPAVNAHIQMGIARLDELPDAVRKFSAKWNVRSETNGVLVAPGETFWRGSGILLIEKSALKARKDDILIAVIGCVTYEILQDGNTHQSAFSYLVQRNDPFLRIRMADAGGYGRDDVFANASSGGFAT